MTDFNGTLYIIKGLPGSGKNTLAEKLGLDPYICSADDYFMKDGVYQFDPSKLPQAHAECQKNVQLCVDMRVDVAVCNTFTQRWEMEPYLSMDYDRLVVIDLFDQGMTDAQLAERNTHGVPVKSITAMRARYEHNWKDGNPVLMWP